MQQTPENIDTLTGFLKRGMVDEKLPSLIARAQEESRTLSIAFLDIDYFKDINDQWGHPTGDRVLLKLAEIIRESVSENIDVYRYGGDEFLLMFPDTEREDAFLIMERLRIEVENSQDFADRAKGQDFRINISAGVATYPLDGQSSDELLRSADQAIYRAKTTRRNTIRLAYEDKMVPKTAHYTQTQLERLAKLAEKEGVGEAVLLREALDYLLIKYEVSNIEG